MDRRRCRRHDDNGKPHPTTPLSSHSPHPLRRSFDSPLTCSRVLLGRNSNQNIDRRFRKTNIKIYVCLILTRISGLRQGISYMYTKCVRLKKKDEETPQGFIGRSPPPPPPTTIFSQTNKFPLPEADNFTNKHPPPF